MARKYNVGVLVLTVLSSGTALAQVPKDPPKDPQKEPVANQSAAPRQSAAENVPLSESKINQFVNAYVEVQSIQQSAATDLKTASGPEKIEAVKQKAEGDMEAAVERSGLAIAEFNQIVQTMQVDENVRSQVAAKVEERLGKPAQ